MNVPPEPPLYPARPKTWLERNWKWFVPVVTLGALIVIGAFTTCIILFVERTLKGSEPYQVAVRQVHASPEVTRTLGVPLQESWLVMGNYRSVNSSHYVDLNFDVTGPKGKAHVFVVGSGTGSDWTYRTLSIEFEDTHQQLDLRPRD